MNRNSVVKEAFALRGKLVSLEYAGLSGSDAKAYREFQVGKSTTIFGQAKHQANGTLVQLGKTAHQVNDCVSLWDRKGAKVATNLNQLIGSR